jgi:hypothetical protein
MTSLLSIRMESREKEIINFSSKLSRAPISKVLGPFITEGSRIALGAVIIFHIDRSSIYRRSSFNSFLDLLRNSPSREGDLVFDREYERMYSATPRIIWDFFELIHEGKTSERFEKLFKGISFEHGVDYVTPLLLRELCYRLSESYVNNGGSLKRLDYDIAIRNLFDLMLNLHYRNCARGTSKALNTQWYTRQDKVSDLVDEIVSKYYKRMEKRVVEAIEVEEGEVISSGEVEARVISEKPKRKKIKRRHQ